MIELWYTYKDDYGQVRSKGKIFDTRKLCDEYVAKNKHFMLEYTIAKAHKPSQK